MQVTSLRRFHYPDCLSDQCDCPERGRLTFARPTAPNEGAAPTPAGSADQSSADQMRPHAPPPPGGVSRKDSAF